MYPQNKELRRTTAKLKMTRKTTNYFDYFKNNQEILDESLFEYCTGKQDAQPETRNPFQAEPVARTFTPPVIPEKVESSRSTTTIRESNVPNNSKQKENDLKQTEELLIKRVTEFVSGLFDLLEKQEEINVFEDFLNANKQSILKAFSNYKITLELLEIEESDHARRISRMDQFTRIQFLFTTIFDNLEKYYDGQIDCYLVLENLFSLDYKLIGVQKKGNLQDLHRHKRSLRRTLDRTTLRSNSKDSHGSGSPILTTDPVDSTNLKEEDIFFNFISKKQAKAEPDPAPKSKPESDKGPDKEEREASLEERQTRDEATKSVDALSSSGFGLPFRKEFQEVPVLKIKTVESESPKSQTRISEFQLKPLESIDMSHFESEQVASGFTGSIKMGKSHFGRLQKSVSSLKTHTNLIGQENSGMTHFQRNNQELVNYNSNQLPQKPKEPKRVFSEQQIGKMMERNQAANPSRFGLDATGQDSEGERSLLTRKNREMEKFNRFLKENTEELHRTVDGLMRTLKRSRMVSEMEQNVIRKVKTMENEKRNREQADAEGSMRQLGGEWVKSQRLLEMNKELTEKYLQYKQYLESKLSKSQANQRKGDRVPGEFEARATEEDREKKSYGEPQ